MEVGWQKREGKYTRPVRLEEECGVMTDLEGLFGDFVCSRDRGDGDGEQGRERYASHVARRAKTVWKEWEEKER